MTAQLRRQPGSTRITPLQFALTFLLCALVTWPGAQLGSGNADANPGLVAQLEQLAQGIPRDKGQTRFGPKIHSADPDGDDSVDLHPGETDSAITWEYDQGFVSPLDRSRQQTARPLKYSPQAPRAPPAA